MKNQKNIGEIQKVEGISNFTIIPNEICQSKVLSPVAKTILIYLLSLPSDWSIVKLQMHKQLGIGRDQFDKGWKQLLDLGYITSEKHFIPKVENYYSYRVTGFPLTNNTLPNNQCVNKETIEINNNKEIISNKDNKQDILDQVEKSSHEVGTDFSLLDEKVKVTPTDTTEGSSFSIKKEKKVTQRGVNAVNVDSLLNRFETYLSSKESGTTNLEKVSEINLLKYFNQSEVDEIIYFNPKYKEVCKLAISEL